MCKCDFLPRFSYLGLCYEFCIKIILYHESDTITITVTRLKMFRGFCLKKIPDVGHNFNLVYFLYFQNMSYLVLVIVVCMVSKCHCVSNGINFIQGPADVYLNCILLDVAFRSIIDCALSSSYMEHYENSGRQLTSHNVFLPVVSTSQITLYVYLPVFWKRLNKQKQTKQTKK